MINREPHLIRRNELIKNNFYNNYNLVYSDTHFTTFFHFLQFFFNFEFLPLADVKPIGQHVVRIAVQLFHPCVISFRMEGRVYINGFKNPKRAFPAFLRCAFAVVIIPPTEGAAPRKYKKIIFER